MRRIGKILPVDGYAVCLKGSLPVHYIKSLTHLYQPLIGSQAIMLYQTLLHELELQGDKIQTHHTLMNYLYLPLDELYEARVKLEAIGLLNTYEKDLDGKRLFTYEIKPPFSPTGFLNDAMLSQLLFHHLGKDRYKLVRELFETDQLPQQGENITAAFNDVFTTIHPTMEQVSSIAHYSKNQGPVVEQIDFSWMEQMLKQRMIPTQSVLTKENRRIITQMMSIYHLATHEVEKTILWALTDENKLDVDEFKEACHHLFQSKHGQSVVKLNRKQINLSDEKPIIEKESTKEEQLIQQLEVISPRQLLADLSSGNQASEQDMKVIREVMTSQGLPSPVMNVLIHYVLLQSNMKLSKAYLEKIASHWSRANLQTAKEAMEFAKMEKNKYQKQQRTKTSTYRNYKQKAPEVIPDWFKNRDKKDQVIPSQETIDFEKEQAEIAAALQEFAKNNNNHFQG
ncbi:chromosome replication initiation protein [Ornithinibacillus gellani]|uniref:replication initiation and membrane attachment family protein n=1 Tax=Ornithinibacillus gellani TaxID=2293253 RepID=UPI000F49F13B|nr:DnaD domain protein [Ornithinibacillus gellani]TQS76233.1 chromosome replication initiation protein [Ornithinibacillus gellani]